MKPSPTQSPLDLIVTAHQHEISAQIRLGLTSDVVRSAAPEGLRSARGRYEAGLRHLAAALRQTRPRARTLGPLRCVLHFGSHRIVAPQAQVMLAAAHIQQADDAYLAAARASQGLLTPRRLAQLGGDRDEAMATGQDALRLAARRYDPAKGAWKRHAISWLMSASRDSGAARLGLTTHGYEIRVKARRLMAEAKAAGFEVSLTEIARQVGTGAEYLRTVLAAQEPMSLDAPMGNTTGRVALLVPDEHEEARQEHVQAAIDIEVLLARMPAREAWVLARLHGLWGTTALKPREVARELGWPVHLIKPLRRRGLHHARGLMRTTAPLTPKGVGHMREAMLSLEMCSPCEGLETRSDEVRALMAAIAPALVPNAPTADEPTAPPTSALATA